MHEINIPAFMATLVIVLAVAKLLGRVAHAVGQPSVLGELIAGVVLGQSLLGLVSSDNQVIEVLAELGVIILLFEIGLETDLSQLLKVGGTSFTVAAVGVALPFALGYAACNLLHLSNLVSIVAGATLTATSVGITARVLSDLNRLQEPESQIILGAAVIDDVIGLVILAIVDGMTKGESVTALGVAQISFIAVGFLVAVISVGLFIIPMTVNQLTRYRILGTPTLLALMIAIGLACLANLAGSAMIIGAFAAGLLLRKTNEAHDIEHGVAHLGQFFVPIFFVSVGAAVDVRTLNPLDPENFETLKIAGLLIFVAVLGKFLAGYAAFWFKGKKHVIGIGMIPRGEVGLIFAQMGLSAKVFDAKLFSALTVVVMATTFIAPPLLKLVFPPKPDPDNLPNESQGIEELVN